MQLRSSGCWQSGAAALWIVVNLTENNSALFDRNPAWQTTSGFYRAKQKT